MVKHEFSTGMARAARAPWRIAALLLAGLAATDAARAADQDATKPLDLSLPRQAGQWTGVASRERQDPRAEIGAGAQQPRRLAVQARPQPYGTGYEARMSSGVATGAAGAAGAGPQGAGASPAAPRGGHGKGR
ncbi:hypothetical protein [Variovorax sp. YR752]|uniref:hypothetical protein n=1 Tax=Variovorax sp. YR752 TaxID=1884383 RepID=UPI003137CC78